MLLVLNKRRKIDFERLDFEPSALNKTKQKSNAIVYSSVFTTWHHLKISFKQGISEVGPNLDYSVYVLLFVSILFSLSCNAHIEKL